MDCIHAWQSDEINDIAQRLVRFPEETVSFGCPPDPSFVAWARSLVMALAMPFGFDRETQADFDLIIGETVGNSIKHSASFSILGVAYPQEISGRRYMRVQVLDFGANAIPSLLFDPLKPATLEDDHQLPYKPEDSIENRRHPLYEEHRGFIIIRALVASCNARYRTRRSHDTNRAQIDCPIGRAA